MHPRVVNVREAKRGTYTYVGRGTKWGNPFTLSAHGPRCMVMFLDMLASPGLLGFGRGLHAVQPAAVNGVALVEAARTELFNLDLGCHCRGVHPVCHAEVWARLADGEELSTIRADLLARIGLEDGGAR